MLKRFRVCTDGAPVSKWILRQKRLNISESAETERAY